MDPYNENIKILNHGNKPGDYSSIGNSSVLQKNESSDEDEDDNPNNLTAIQSLAFNTIEATSAVDVERLEPLFIKNQIIETDLSIAATTSDALNKNINLFTFKQYSFIPGYTINIKLIQIKEINSKIHFRQPINFKIKLKHGQSYKWNVKRSYKEIRDLHRRLVKYVKDKYNIDCSRIPKNEIQTDWPLFPIFHENFLRPQRDVKLVIENLESYLRLLLNSAEYRNQLCVAEFLGISHLSFLNGVSQSIIEGHLTKRFYDVVIPGSCVLLKKLWIEFLKPIRDERWIVVKDTYITYLNRDRGSNYLGFVLLIDNTFECTKKTMPGAIYGLQIKNGQRSLFLKCKTSNTQAEWHTKLAIDLKKSADDFIKPNVFHSYAPERSNQMCRWYVNAAGYMEDIMYGILNAKEEIFITDWWLCPEIYLKRPAQDRLDYRLDELLFKKAKEGVKIYILLFKEVKFAIGLVSGRVKRVLTGNSPNILVLRHPLNSSKNPLQMTMWSHHEKMVIIDQQVAFSGGIDLCYGRYDDELHRLVDLGAQQNKLELNIDQTTTVNNSEIIYNSFDLGLKSAIHSITTNTITILNQMNDRRPNTMSDTESQSGKFKRSKRFKKSILKRFNQLKQKTKSIAHNTISGGSSNSSSSSEDDEATRAKSPQLFSDFDENISSSVHQNEGCFWPGKDYSNPYIQDTIEPELHDKDQFNREQVHRMPWRDEAFVLFGKSASDLARHFIQRWNHAKYELAYGDNFYPYLLPRSMISDSENNSSLYWFKKSLSKCTVQLTRSLSAWSGGIYETESSIQNAYIQLIQQAEHYIYIENQFFVTTCDPIRDSVCKNQIGKALLDRITIAHNKKENFKVYIVLPLFPGFDSQNSIRAVQYFNLRSIKFGDYSIWKQLVIRGINPNEYITFHGMRNWSILMGKLVQEIIYVHSKLMIVDDKYVICGSANINDRSLLGKRDSEIAAVIKDEEFLDSILNKQSVKVGRYAYSLRKKIFKLHLGIYSSNPYKININDCASDEFFRTFKRVSRQNTEIYDKVFKCSPANCETTFSEWKLHLNEISLSKQSPSKAKEELENGICGFIVDFPLDFLSRENNFKPEMTTKEGLMPDDLWV